MVGEFINLEKSLQTNIEGAIAQEIKKYSEASSLFKEGVVYYKLLRSRLGIIIKIKTTTDDRRIT